MWHPIPSVDLSSCISQKPMDSQLSSGACPILREPDQVNQREYSATAGDVDLFEILETINITFEGYNHETGKSITDLLISNY